MYGGDGEGEERERGEAQWERGGKMESGGSQVRAVPATATDAGSAVTSNHQGSGVMYGAVRCLRPTKGQKYVVITTK